MPFLRLFSLALRPFSLLGLVLLSMSSAYGGEDEPKFLPDTKFVGTDIREFNLPQGNPRICYEACLQEKRCRAFTYLQPHGGTEAQPMAHCWLKSGVSEVRHETCCISGIVRGEQPPVSKPESAPSPKPVPPRSKLQKPDLEYISAKDVKLAATPAAYEGACPVRVTYRGLITASKRGKVTYEFDHGDQKGKSRELAFDSPGTKEVTLTVMAGSPGKHDDFRETLQLYDFNPILCVRGPCPQWAPGQSAEVVTTLNCITASKQALSTQANPKENPE